MLRYRMPAFTISILLGSIICQLSPADDWKRSLRQPPHKIYLQTAGRRQKDLRQREGTKILEVAGRFQLAGEKVTFVPIDAPEGTSYRVLENLALERVLDHLNESRTERLWTVSGNLTEFRSANFLLITKAVIQSQDPVETAP